MEYYLNTILDTSFEDAVSRVTDALKTEGFGIITEIQSLLSDSSKCNK
jgi:uncharacterized protein (DUF302 family)